MVKKQAHLSDLLTTGKEVRFEASTIDGDELEVLIWLRKPPAQLHEEAVAKARGAQARRKAVYRDKNSDEYIALMDDMEQFETKEDLLRELMRFEEGDLQSQAYNEVLYDEAFAPRDEEGNLVWGPEGREYIELMAAIAQRMYEIEEFNEKLGMEDREMRKTFEDDEELQRLQGQRESFEDAVAARYDDLYEAKKAELKGQRFEDMRQNLVKRMTDLDSSLAWHEVYRKWLLLFTCRMPDNHKERYFKSFEEIDLLPPFVLQTLVEEMEDLTQGVDSTKNLLSLQRSSS